MGMYILDQRCVDRCTVLSFCQGFRNICFALPVGKMGILGPAHIKGPNLQYDGFTQMECSRLLCGRTSVYSNIPGIQRFNSKS